jgi:16S rRNA (guanine527-N7)-methyltransferase
MFLTWNWWWDFLNSFFPETRFHLIDIIIKKIKVVQAVVDGLGLENVKAEQLRAELVKGDFDFIVSRAVTMPFCVLDKRQIKKESKHELRNGILYLKGGDLTEELKDSPKATQYDLSDFSSKMNFLKRKSGACTVEVYG